MVVLHIATITNDSCDGISVVVPNHIKAQSKYANIGFCNVNKEKISQIEAYQLNWNGDFSLSMLKSPFNKPDLVVFHEIYRMQYVKIAQQIRKVNIPYIVVPHSQLTQEAMKRKRIKKIIANIVCFNSFVSHATAIQFLSKAEKQSSNKGKRSFIATNGISLPTINKVSFSAEGLRFIYIGRLESYQKGLDILIDAFKRSANAVRASGSSLNIYGPDLDGRYQTLLNMIKENKINDIVKLHHEVTFDDKVSVLMNSDVFIQSSRFEGMPMGLLEAMSYGVPCMVTEGTTLGEIIKENNAGWACETNAVALSNLITKTINKHDDLMIKSKNSINVIRTKFSWDKIARETICRYKAIIKRR